MRIGIDCRTILDEGAREKAGVAHYTYYLVKNLVRQDRESEYVLFFENKVSPALLREIGNWGDKVSIQKFHFSQYKRYLPYVYSHLFIANQIQKAKLDVFHSPANVVPLGLFTPSFISPLKRGRKRGGRFPSSSGQGGEERGGRPRIIATVHDLAIYRHPEWFPAGQGFSIKYLVPKTIQQVDHLIVPSQATARDIQELFHISEEKITVIPHGVEERFFKPSTGSGNINSLNEPPTTYHLPSTPYILFVGTLEPRKNLGRLIEAYAKLPADILEKYRLVIAGQKGWKYQEALRQIQMANDKFQKEKIKVLGYYPGGQLPELLQNAAVFVYPSLYEGFGLPVLEAMAAGCPVVTSRSSSLPEVCGQAGILIDPHSVIELTDAIVRLLQDQSLSRRLAQEGIRRAQEFSWQQAAQKTLDLYGRVFASASAISH